MKNTQRRSSWFALVVTLVITSLAAAADSWKVDVADHLKLYGHRNWIVVADSAYPAQTGAGVETIVSYGDQTEVLHFVLSRIAESASVRPVIYTDKELAFVPESEAPGISQYRRTLAGLFGEQPVTTLLHESLIARLDEASQKFKVLIIKTNMAIPYTSVFLELRAAYWGDEPEKRLRESMAAQEKK